MILISIIIPVYNSQKWLSRTIESVIVQNFKNWELLLIDDGSTDGSWETCRKYAKEDSRIKIFHKDNGGVSSARNLALDHVTAKWVTFVDSDDEVKPDYLMYFASGEGEHSCDFAFLTDYMTNYQGKESVHHVGNTDFFDKERILDFLNLYIDNPILKAVHSNFFRNDIIQKNKVRFNSSVRVGEDHLFVMEYLKYIHSAKVVKGIGYIYFLPLDFSLKYGQNLKEIIYRMALIEKELCEIERNHGIDLSSEKKDKWRHALARVNIFDFYDSNIFLSFMQMYENKVKMNYSNDALCNRECRAARTLMHIANKCTYRKQYLELVSLVCRNTERTAYRADTFPLSTKVILFIASIHSTVLLNFFLFLFYGIRKN